MESFVVHEGLVAPMDRANVDTDLIMPKQFLKSIRRSGFGPNLFDDLRYLDEGVPDADNSTRPLNPYFPLNFPRYQGASIFSRARISGVDPVASTHLGRWWTMDFARLSPRVLPTFSALIASRTAFCLSPWIRRLWTGCLPRSMRKRASVCQSI